MYFADKCRCTALLVLPGHLREKLDVFLRTDEDAANASAQGEQPSHPVMFWQGTSTLDETASFRLYMENVCIARTKSLLDAFQLLLAAFYVFNVAYPSKGSRTLTFMQKAVLNIQDSEKRDPKVADLIGKLNVM